MSILESSLAYRTAGLSVLPACLAEKRPTLSAWKPYRLALPTEEQVRSWCEHAEAICIITGAGSGNLEILDFDVGGEKYAEWRKHLDPMAPGLCDRLVIERSPSGGYHAAYRCESPVCGNMKLAQRKQYVESGDEIVICGKKYKPHQDRDGRWYVILTLIETRGEGGLFLCAPSPGYEIVQGDYGKLPVLTSDEREMLLAVAWGLNEYTPEAVGASSPPSQKPPDDSTRPGDDFNARGDMRELLKKHGWTLTKCGVNEYWRRPGKEHGWSATLKNNLLYVFSSNAVPFESERAYSPFGVYAHLEHGGDFAKAASALRSEGYGAPPPAGVAGNLAGLITPAAVQEALASAHELTPEDLVRYDSVSDPNTLLGRRWLCRAGSCLLVGQTGLGKSSLSVQAAISWAVGEPFFNIQPVRPLKSLIIQAENDIGDLSEMFTGVLEGTDHKYLLDRLQSQIVFVTETARCGDAFHPFAEALIKKHKPDIVWVDPLFAYLGGNVSDQEAVSIFLRNGLGRISQETGVAWMIVHHANKPARDPAVRNAYVGGDFSYLGAGSAELANWARSVIVLREVEDGLFELRAAKRGKRAGLLNANGEPVTEIYLKHGKRYVCWERAESVDLGHIAPADEKIEWTPETFVERFITQEPKDMDCILEEGLRSDLSVQRAKRLLRVAMVNKLAFQWNLGQKQSAYATRPQPEEQIPNEESPPNKRDEVEAVLQGELNLSNTEVAQRCGVSDRYVRRIRAEQADQNHAE